jgi:hypothetical protein
VRDRVGPDGVTGTLATSGVHRHNDGMAADYTHTDAFRGATFTDADLTGATFRQCDLRQVRIVGCVLDDVQISGFGGESGTVVVDDVDVTAFVAAELDARYPERVQLRVATTADDHRAVWETLDHLWSEALTRAERLPVELRAEQVNGEWSFVETLRHLVFAIDVWVGRMVLGQPMPYHRLGLPPTDYPAEDAIRLGIELDARPPYDEVLAVYGDRSAQLRDTLAAVMDAGLEELRTAAPAPAWGVETHSVRTCLRVVLREHCEHRRFAVRDLAVLEAS